MRLVGLVGLLLLAMLFSLTVGAVSISWSSLAEVVTTGPQGTGVESVILWQLRLPRVLLACVVGCGLGVAGTGYQGLFRNPLADPFVIGASSGAALGATVAMIGDWHGSFAGLAPVSVSALVGALLAVSCVYLIAAIGGLVPTISLLLAGVAVSSFLGAVVSLLMFLNSEELVTIFSWLMGSFSGSTWTILGSTAPLIALGVMVIALLARPLDALTFGEEAATTLGLPLSQFRALLVIAASLTTGACVAAAGIVGFVGLISPHIARFFVGARHSVLIPASGILGAALLLIADDVSRTLAAPGELPVGVVTALLGGPFFLYLLKTQQHRLGQGS
ncbi:Hemin transport system permease protein HmuU [Planctomycetales bacterium 10988]|nr:Hemin transport system permease protein HmuU [Planctomycetales bacterium 10988]